MAFLTPVLGKKEWIGAATSPLFLSTRASELLFEIYISDIHPKGSIPLLSDWVQDTGYRLNSFIGSVAQDTDTGTPISEKIIPSLTGLISMVSWPLGTPVTSKKNLSILSLPTSSLASLSTELLFCFMDFIFTSFAVPPFLLNTISKSQLYISLPLAFSP